MFLMPLLAGNEGWVAANNYSVELPTGTSIAERVLWPNGPAGPLSRITASDR